MADLPSDLVVAGVAPSLDEAAAVRVAGRWRGSIGVIVPGAMVLFIIALCFIWPIVGPVPPPTGGNILNASLPAFSPAISSAPIRSGTTSGRGSCTAAGPR